MNADRDERYLSPPALDSVDCLLHEHLGIDARQRYGSLSAQARHAIKQYVLDNVLHSEILLDGTSEINRYSPLETWQELALIEEAMSTLDHPITVWRGCDLAHVADMLTGYWAAYMSTSVCSGVALDFAKKRENPVLLKITVSAGHPLLLIPPYLYHDCDEGEVLLDRSTALESKALFETSNIQLDDTWERLDKVSVIDMHTCGQRSYVEIPAEVWESLDSAQVAC